MHMIIYGLGRINNVSPWVDVISGRSEVKGQAPWTRTRGLMIFQIRVVSQNLIFQDKVNPITKNRIMYLYRYMTSQLFSLINFF